MKLAIGLFGLGIGMIIGVIITGTGAILILLPAADYESGSSDSPTSSPASVSSPTPSSVSSSSLSASRFDPSLDTEEEKFLELINQYRQEQGLSPLVTRSELNDVAYWKSRDMALENYFSHTDSEGRDPFQLMSAFGYPEGCWRGENLAAGVSDAEYAFLLWKDSPGHNANMLHSGFTEIGISRFADPASDYGWYWATEFGGCSK